MNPNNRALWLCIVLMALAILTLARHQTHPEAVQTVSKPQADTQDVMDANPLQIVAQEAEIASLQQELHDVELTSRSVGLLTLKPGRWRNGWIATFYTGQAGINGSGTGITKSGNPVASDWTCASDPSLLPLGTIIEVRFENGSQQIMQCTDTGSAIKGRRLDIYAPSYAEDMRLGRQRVKIRVLRWG